MKCWHNWIYTWKKKIGTKFCTIHQNKCTEGKEREKDRQRERQRKKKGSKNIQVLEKR